MVGGLPVPDSLRCLAHAVHRPQSLSTTHPAFLTKCLTALELRPAKASHTLGWLKRVGKVDVLGQAKFVREPLTGCGVSLAASQK
jgi:hypothetical protein